MKCRKNIFVEIFQHGDTRRCELFQTVNFKQKYGELLHLLNCCYLFYYRNTKQERRIQQTSSTRLTPENTPHELCFYSSSSGSLLVFPSIDVISSGSAHLRADFMCNFRWKIGRKSVKLKTSKSNLCVDAVEKFSALSSYFYCLLFCYLL